MISSNNIIKNKLNNGKNIKSENGKMNYSPYFHCVEIVDQKWIAIS